MRSNQLLTEPGQPGRAPVSPGRAQSAGIAIPWHRRDEFVFGSLAALVVLGLVMLPGPGQLRAAQTALVLTFFALALAWFGLLLTHPAKPEWAKTAAAFALLILAGWLFYRYADAEWSRLNHAFFAWDLMAAPMEGGVTGWSILLSGLWLTLQIAFFSIIFSTLIGLLLAVFRSFNNPVLSAFIIAYIDFFRAMPIIVLMVLIYYALPYTGIRLSNMVSGILALSLNSSAYVAEIFRAGILSVKYGQIEASRALGLTPMKTMRLVILPQAIRVVIPPLAGNYVASIKDTAICSSIAILELLKSGMQVQAFYANPTALIAVTGMYILFLVPLTRLAGVLENRMKTGRRTARN